MNLDFKQGSINFDEFKKCGEIYRSPKISDKQYTFLSCTYCKNISWQLDTFLEHLDNVHQMVDDIYTNFYKDEDFVEENTTSINSVNKTKVEENLQEQTSAKNSENVMIC